MDTRVPSSTEIHTVVVVLLKLHVLNGKKKKILFIHHLFLGLESIAQSTMLSVGWWVVTEPSVATDTLLYATSMLTKLIEICRRSWDAKGVVGSVALGFCKGGGVCFCAPSLKSTFTTTAVRLFRAWFCCAVTFATAAEWTKSSVRSKTIAKATHFVGCTVWWVRAPSVGVWCGVIWEASGGESVGVWCSVIWEASGGEKGKKQHTKTHHVRRE